MTTAGDPWVPGCPVGPPRCGSATLQDGLRYSTMTLAVMPARWCPSTLHRIGYSPGWLKVNSQLSPAASRGDSNPKGPVSPLSTVAWTTLCWMTSSFLKMTFWPAFTRISAGSKRKFFMLTVTAAACEELPLDAPLRAADPEEPPPPHAVTRRARTSSPASRPTGRHLEI